MDAKEQQLVFFQSTDGKCPFTEWFLSLKDDRATQRIEARLARVRLGNFGDCKSVGEGVSELRVSYGPGYRIYFSRDGDRVVVLLQGGDKGSQSRDIKKAKAFWGEYKLEKSDADN